MSKKPDLNKPRFGKKKFRKDIVDKEFYDKLLNEYDLKESYKEIKDIAGYINLVITENIISERDGVRLPNLIGNIFLGFIPYYDRGHGRKVHAHTNNVYSMMKFPKIVFEKNEKYNIEGSGYFSYEPYRDFDRKAREAFRENPEIYKNVRLKKHDRDKRTVDLSD